MANFVIKSDGSKVPFDAEKMKGSIMAAGTDAGLAEEENNKITQEVSSAVLMDLEDKEEVSSGDIKTMILAKLDASYPNVAEAWRKYDQSKTA